MAEILLQKTKAADALPVWSERVATFPSPALLLDASDQELRERISHLGLGSQRTSRLRAIANTFARGEDWRQSSGIGSYAKAVIALTLGDDASTQPPVDGNIARLMARYHGFSFEKGEARKKKEVRQAVSEFLMAAGDAEERRRLLYALLDADDSVCTPAKPSCGVCPLVDGCQFAATSGQS